MHCGVLDIFTCICRLREIVRRLKSGQVDKTTLVDNLEYAADVLENVYKVETMYCHILLCIICLRGSRISRKCLVPHVFSNSAFTSMFFIEFGINVSYIRSGISLERTPEIGNKRLSYRRGTARRATSVDILSAAV